MQLRNWWYGLILVFIFTNLEACPITWTLLKETSEGPFYSNDDYEFNVDRRIFYKCVGGEIKFETTRWVSSPQIFSGYEIWYGSQKCIDSCDEKNVTMTVWVHEWSTSFSYVEKNCDKFYWSSWTETFNCLTSSKKTYTRKCVDCDGEDFKFKINCPGETTKAEQCYPSWSTWVTRNCSATNCNLTEESTKTWDCFFENKTEAFNANLCWKNLKSINVLCKPKWGNLEILCRPFWSMWMTGNCSGIYCNSTGKRVRTRNCLYGDGSNSASNKLCSNQANTKIEQCITNFSHCSYVKSQPKAKESNALGDVAISVSICVISIVLIVIAVYLRKNKISKQECLKFTFENTSQDNSNNQSLSVNEIYNSRPVNNIVLTKNSKPSELTSAANYVNQDSFITIQKKTPDNTYEMALENWDETRKDMNNIYTHLKNSDQSHSDKDNTYDHLENFNKIHSDANNTQHLEHSNKTHKATNNTCQHLNNSDKTS